MLKMRNANLDSASKICIFAIAGTDGRGIGPCYPFFCVTFKFSPILSEKTRLTSVFSAGGTLFSESRKRYLHPPFLRTSAGASPKTS